VLVPPVAALLSNRLTGARFEASSSSERGVWFLANARIGCVRGLTAEVTSGCSSYGEGGIMGCGGNLNSRNEASCLATDGVEKLGLGVRTLKGISLCSSVAEGNGRDGG